MDAINRLLDTEFAHAGRPAGILLIGLLSGTYSSIFIAAPILVLWENREWKTWFRKPAEA